MRLIDAEVLDKAMYHKTFEVDDGRNVWNSGLWIRYKIWEEAREEAPTIEAISVKWIDKYIADETNGRKSEMQPIGRMLEAWREEHETD